MRAVDAVITWTPDIPDMPKDLRGKVSVSSFPLRGKARRHLMTRGAGDSDWDNASPEVLEKAIFVEYNTLVARDGINPKLAHREFRKIYEYRQNIAPDF